MPKEHCVVLSILMQQIFLILSVRQSAVKSQKNLDLFVKVLFVLQKRKLICIGK